MEADKAEEPAPAVAAAVDMELEPAADDRRAPEDGAAEGSATVANGVRRPGENGVGKRESRDGEGNDEGEGVGEWVKRQKVERSVEEERLESTGKEEAAGEEGKKDGDDGDGNGEAEGCPVKIGPKSFRSSVEMFGYFYKLLHSWSPNFDMNKYEYMVLMDLIKKGHSEPDKKIGGGIEAFQVRYHPLWKSKCFFLQRVDGSNDDFSFRKCVDNVFPLPDDMKVREDKRSGSNKKGGRGSGGRGGRHGGRGGGLHGGGRGKRGRFGK